MNNWITLTADHLKAAGYGKIVDLARTRAVGGIDPVDEALAEATARVRRAVAAGNALEADATTVPASLQGVALRRALYALMERLGLPLSEDQKTTRRADRDDLTALAERRGQVEAPETPAGAGEMQAPGRRAAAVSVPPRQTGRERTSGL